MRHAALLLALALLTPPVAGALCAVTCSSAHGPAAHPPAEQDCHLDGHDGRAHTLRSADQPACHQTAEGPRASSVMPPQHAPVAAFSRTSAIEPPIARHDDAATARPEIRPPDILRIGPQLRI